MKSCPTCGREVADSVSVCESCEAWATALVETRPDDDAVQATQAPPTDGNAPVGAAPTAPAGRGAGSQRQLMYVGAGVAVVALTGFAISVRGGSAPNAPATAAVPAADVRPATATATPPSAAAAVQTWNTENQATWLGHRRRGAAFELASENVVKTWFGPARASLVVRCTSQSIEAFVVTRSPMKIVPRVDGKAVTIRVDGDAVRTEHWIDSDDHTVVFAPDPAAFVERLRKARTLGFGYSPHNSSDVVAEFNVSGIDELIGAASKECGLAKPVSASSAPLSGAPRGRATPRR